MDYQGFIGETAIGRNVALSPERSINLMPEIILRSGQQAAAALVSIPGLQRFATIAGGPIRALYTATNGRTFVVSGSQLLEVFASSVTIPRGTLATSTGFVSLADNGLMLALVDGPHGYGLTFSTNVFAQWVDPDFKGGNTIQFLDGRFVMNTPGTGQFQWTDLYAETVDALSFATAEARADNIVGLLVDHRELWIFGTQTAEVFYSTGDSLNPFQRLPGALIELGATGAPSLASLANTVFWITANQRGQGVVVQAQGYQPRRISTPAVEWALSQSKKLHEARALTYTDAGHSFYGLYVPDLETSWYYDMSTEQWTERATLLAQPFVGVLPGAFIPWRPHCHTFAYGKHIVGSRQDGRLWSLEPTHYADDERELVRVRIPPPLRAEGNRMTISTLRLHMQQGIGLDAGVVPGTEPQVMLRVSRDGGNVFGTPSWSQAGKIGDYQKMVEWRRLGLARQWAIEVSVSDPVPVVFTGASVF